MCVGMHTRTDRHVLLLNSNHYYFPEVLSKLPGSQESALGPKIAVFGLSLFWEGWFGFFFSFQALKNHIF